MEALAVGRLRWHALALAMAVLAAWPLLHFEGVFTTDEGSYGLQARTLGMQTWDMGYAFVDADPGGELVPFHEARVVDGEVVPYSKHPLVPVLMSGAARALGEEAGFRAFGVASVVALAVIAWGIAGHLGGRRARPWAFWLAASSPILANAWLLWPHAQAAVAGGLLVLAGLRVERRWMWLPVAVLASSAGVLLRSEGLLWAAAVGAALLLCGPGSRQRWCGAAVSFAAVAAVAGERLWRNGIVGTASSLGLEDRAPGATLGGRLGGLRTALIDASVASDAARLLGLGVLVAMLATALWLRRDPPGEHVGGVLVLVAAVLLGVRLAVAADDPILGLLAAAPSLVLAVIWRPADRALVWVPAALALFVGALAATIYTDGGAMQWGGRFLSPLLGPLAAMAGCVVAAHAASPTAGASARHRLLAGGVASLLAVQAAGALVVPDHIRESTSRQLASVTAIDEPVIVAWGQQVPRLDWRGWPDRCWISIPPTGDVTDVRAVLDVLARSGVAAAAYAGVEPSLLRDAGAAVQPDVDNPRVGRLVVPGPAAERRISPPYRCPA